VPQHDNSVDAVPFGDTVPGPLPPARPALILSLSRSSLRPKGNAMAWTTPILIEICVGLEINGYLPAEF
jgi:coenzyme PQQ precursor peptide PqqA